MAKHSTSNVRRGIKKEKKLACVVAIIILFQFGGPTTDSIPRVGGRFVHNFSESLNYDTAQFRKSTCIF